MPMCVTRTVIGCKSITGPQRPIKSSLLTVFKLF